MVLRAGKLWTGGDLGNIKERSTEGCAGVKKRRGHRKSDIWRKCIEEGSGCHKPGGW